MFRRSISSSGSGRFSHRRSLRPVCRLRGSFGRNIPAVAVAPPTAVAPGSVRHRSGGGTGGSSYSATGPSAELKSWESGARMVRNTEIENRYTEQIRDVHDPSRHLETIEDELKGTIGKALGKQARKILAHAELMDEQRARHEALSREAGEDGPERIGGDKRRKRSLREAAAAHNQHRKDCVHARWELMVHRQAAGFTVGNHKFVNDKFPIGDALPVDDDDGDSGTGDDASKRKPKPKAFTDQLDWWSRIGRWK